MNKVLGSQRMNKVLGSRNTLLLISNIFCQGSFRILNSQVKLGIVASNFMLGTEKDFSFFAYYRLTSYFYSSLSQHSQLDINIYQCD